MSRLPSAYQEVEYLESIGYQYIQTNVSIQDVRRVVGDVSFTSTTPSEFNYVAGVRNNASTAIGFGILAPSRGGFTCYPFEWKTNDIAYAITANEKINFDTAINETDTTFKVNGTTKYSGVTSTTPDRADFSGTRTIAIGALLSIPAQGSPRPQYFLNGKIFDIKMYDGSNNLIFNGVPAKNSSNVLGLYDLVSDTFLTNAGAGTFIAGPDVLYGQLGGVDVAKSTGIEVVNGIIEQYKASTSTISANSFVEFVNSMNTGTDTTLVDVSSSYPSTSAVLIDTNKVFIAHRSDSNYYLNGIVCTISGTSITTGSDTTLVSKDSSREAITIALIENNKVFIAHRNGGGSSGINHYLNGIVCTISGTSITTGSDTTLVSVVNSEYGASAVLIDTNKVFVAHSDGAITYLNGIVCTISGTTITAGTDTSLVLVASSYNNASAVLIDTNKVFIAHRSDGTNNYLNGIICTISGTTITAATDTTLVSSANAYSSANAVLANTNKVFIAHRSDGTNNYLNGIIVDLTPTIKESETQIDGITKTECTTTSEGEVYVL